MKLVPILGILFFSQAFADCRFSNGSGITTIPENTSLSLFEEGKSLATHKTQDQDGLGTCYANATSAVLKSILPDNPDVSFTHAALEASTNGWRQNWRTSPGKYVTKENESLSDFTSGGFLCETVGAMENSGGACPAKFSITEDKTLLDPYLQQRLFLSLGSYFDHINSLKKNPDDFKKLKNDLALAIDTIRNERQEIVQACEREKNEEIPLDQAVSNFISNEILLLNTETKCGSAWRDFYKTFLHPSSVIQDDRVVAKASDEALAKFRQMIEGNDQFKSRILAEIHTENRNLRPNRESNLALGNGLLDIIAKNPLMEQLNEACKDEPATTEVRSIEDLGKAFIVNIKTQSQRPCEHILSQSILAPESNTCIDTTQLDSLLSAIVPLLEIGNALDMKTIEDLSNTTAVNGLQLKKMLTPGCLDSKNLIPLKDVSCASFSMCDESQYFDTDNNNYNGPAGSCYSKDRATNELRMRIFRDIKENRALGITVCTAFMTTPNAQTDFCRNPVPGVPKHAYHAMTVSGLRCIGGKMEYEILNSWGQTCPESASDVSSGIECEVDKDNNPTGKFWVKEDVLVDSTTNIVQMKLQKKGGK
ncbi:MAG: hypothetical protein ACLGHN_10390 [Bacteriovoracia bacterium]